MGVTFLLFFCIYLFSFIFSTLTLHPELLSLHACFLTQKAPGWDACVRPDECRRHWDTQRADEASHDVTHWCSREVGFYLKCCMNCLNASTVSVSGTMILMRIWDVSISSSFTFISGANGRKNTSLLKSEVFSLNVRSYNVPLSSLCERFLPLERNYMWSSLYCKNNQHFNNKRLYKWWNLLK